VGTFFTPVVDRFEFSVSVTEALEHGVSLLCVDADRAAEFSEAAHVGWSGRYERGLVVGPADGTLVPEMFPELPEGFRWVADGRRWREDIGAKVESVWFDGNSEHYGSNDRSVDLVTVREGFRMWEVEILGWGSPSSRFGVGPATDVRVRDSYLVRPGTYLCGEEFSRYGGTGAPDVVAYVGPAEMHLDRYGYSDTREHLFYALAESEGWCADRAFAGCDTCGGRWAAEGGSWRFRHDVDLAEGPVVEDFDYDDTSGHDGSSVACPSGTAVEDDACIPCSGRVFFDVF
jgi:hypothetical protein